MADLRIVDVVARGAVEEFDAAVHQADADHDHLRHAAARLQRLLIECGRADEARALVDDLTCLVASDALSERPDTARESTVPL